jgi:hypothetical protein
MKAIHQINLKKSVAMFSSCYKITASENKSEKVIVTSWSRFSIIEHVLNLKIDSLDAYW